VSTNGSEFVWINKFVMGWFGQIWVEKSAVVMG
jgi:hypothetical protein